MRAGLFRHRITIQERSGPEWVYFATAWAERRELGAKEKFERSDQLLQPEKLIRWRIRYRAGLTDKMRVVWNSRAFDIQQIEEPDNTDQVMALLCLEVPYEG